MVKECDMYNYLTQLFFMYTCDFLIKFILVLNAEVVCCCYNTS